GVGAGGGPARSATPGSADHSPDGRREARLSAAAVVPGTCPGRPGRPAPASTRRPCATMTRMDDDDRMAEMRRWLTAVCTELGLDPAVLDETTDELLDLVRDVAHGPTRPGAPLTAFLVGLEIGRASCRERGYMAGVAVATEREQ